MATFVKAKNGKKAGFTSKAPTSRSKKILQCNDGFGIYVDEHNQVSLLFAGRASLYDLYVLYGENFQEYLDEHRNKN